MLWISSGVPEFEQQSASPRCSFESIDIPARIHTKEAIRFEPSLAIRQVPEQAWLSAALGSLSIVPVASLAGFTILALIVHTVLDGLFPEGSDILLPLSLAFLEQGLCAFARNLLA
jgi:hypothetical protein